MLHRRLLCDDSKGLGDSLNEIEPNGEEGLQVISKHILQFGKGYQASFKRKETQNGIYASLMNFYTRTSSLPHNQDHYKKDFQEDFLKLKNSNKFFTQIDTRKLNEGNINQFNFHQLPPNVILITLMYNNDSSILVRFAHLYEMNEHPIYSSLVKLNFHGLFPLLEIQEISEMQLSGVSLKRDIQELHWGIDNRNKEERNKRTEVRDDEEKKGIFTISCMEIKTFMIKI